jgi:hypothetical protein
LTVTELVLLVAVTPEPAGEPLLYGAQALKAFAILVARVVVLALVINDAAVFAVVQPSEPLLPPVAAAQLNTALPLLGVPERNTPGTAVLVAETVLWPPVLVATTPSALNPLLQALIALATCAATVAVVMGLVFVAEPKAYFALARLAQEFEPSEPPDMPAVVLKPVGAFAPPLMPPQSLPVALQPVRQ